MSKKFLKEVVSIIVGKQAEEITDLLDGNKYINEFLIAKKLNMTINQTRNILYKISDHGLVSFIRKKDKKKGWYTYFWKIEVMKSLEFLKNILSKKIDQMNSQIKNRESKEFYVCERCNIEFNSENALLHDFTCEECGDIFVLKDNTKVLKEFKKNLDKMEKELKLVNEEIIKEREILDKKKIKEIKIIEKEKLKQKAERKAARKAIKTSLKNKKTPKKPSKIKSKFSKKLKIKK